MPNSDLLNVLCVPAFADNYLWVLHRGGHAAVVDPGDAAAVKRALEAHQLTLDAILVTHHHPDHIGGVAELSLNGTIPVLGPRAENSRISGLTRTLVEGEQIEVLGAQAQVMEMPGHTLGHIAYHFADDGLLFCGDTLFSAGCGRLFEGTPAQMLGSLSRLAALPEATAVYCAHEYTQANLAFAHAVEPDNDLIADTIDQVAALRRQGTPSIPSRIGLEKKINPFLRSREPAVGAMAQRHTGEQLADEVSVFAALRAWKDTFRAPKTT